MAIPGFIARAGIAVGVVCDRFPQAEVHRVEAAASAGPTTTPMALDRLRVLAGIYEYMHRHGMARVADIAIPH